MEWNYVYRTSLWNYIIESKYIDRVEKFTVNK